MCGDHLSVDNSQFALDIQLCGQRLNTKKKQIQKIFIHFSTSNELTTIEETYLLNGQTN